MKNPIKFLIQIILYTLTILYTLKAVISWTEMSLVVVVPWIAILIIIITIYDHTIISKGLKKHILCLMLELALFIIVVLMILHNNLIHILWYKH